jgi:hypothetical protein
MSAPLMPSPLDYIGRQKFAFYPAIKNIDPNEWILGVGSRSDIQVVNAKTGGEMWIPWQYIGAVSESGESLIVGLRKELEFRAGSLEPLVKCVIEMPAPQGSSPPNPLEKLGRRSGPAPVIGIKTENGGSGINKALIALAVAFIISYLAWIVSDALRR